MTTGTSAMQEFRLPDVGEGLTEAEIVAWRVAVGDHVEINQVLVEIETAKSLVELPSPFAGEVRELFVAEGATVAVGTPIIAVAPPGSGEPADDAGSAPGTSGSGEPASGASALGTSASGTVNAANGKAVNGKAANGNGNGVTSDVEGSGPVLVGYGPRARTLQPRRRLAVAPPAATAPATTVTPPVATQLAGGREPEAKDGVHPQVDAPGTGSPEPAATAPLAKPPVRALARDLGVDLAQVAPTGPGGVITREDVTAAAERLEVAQRERLLRGPEGGAVQERGSRAGQETRIPVRGVRKATAQAMVASAFTAPQTSAWVTTDVERSMQFLERLRADPAFEGVKVSPLLLAARALLLAVRRHPEMNSCWDPSPSGEGADIVIKHYVNLGIAAATERGLVVPTIKDADQLSLRELAIAINRLAVTAREGRTPPSDLTGGSITITNVGIFGVDGGTPILNPGETTILCLGQVARRPWVHKGKVRPRRVSTISISFDHRIVDGDRASRFLADIAAMLEEPRLMLAWS